MKLFRLFYDKATPYRFLTAAIAGHMQKAPRRSEAPLRNMRLLAGDGALRGHASIVDRRTDRHHEAVADVGVWHDAVEVVGQEVLILRPPFRVLLFY